MKLAPMGQEPVARPPPKSLISQSVWPSGKGLIPADYETWVKRRRAIAPGFHKLYLERMVSEFGQANANLIPQLLKVAEEGRVLDMEERRGQPVERAIFRAAELAKPALLIPLRCWRSAALLTPEGRRSRLTLFQGRRRGREGAATSPISRLSTPRYGSLALDVIGKAVFNYDFGSVNEESPVVKAAIRTLGEVEHRALTPAPYWKLPGASTCS